MAKKRKQKYLTEGNHPPYREFPRNQYGLGDSLKSAFSSEGSGWGAVGGVASSLLSGGRSTAVGNLMTTAGSVVPGPWGLALSAAGGLVNNMFGSTINEENVQAAKQNINELSTFNSNAGSWDELSANVANQPTVMGFDQGFIGSDGIFSNDASNLYNDLKGKQAKAIKHVASSIHNNAENIDTNQDLNMLANHKSFGGSLDTQGSSFPLGYTEVNTGGTHEENPYEGVQMGVDPEGIPNLVEEGEVIYNDYVFSNRLTVPKDMRKKYKLGNRPLTYAEASKKLAKEAEERPNDPISRRGLDAAIDALTQSQEEVRTMKQAREAQKQLASMTPEEQQMLMAQMQGGQEGGIMPQDESMISQQPMMACGGKLHAHGGLLGNLYDDGSRLTTLTPWAAQSNYNRSTSRAGRPSNNEYKSWEGFIGWDPNANDYLADYSGDGFKTWFNALSDDDINKYFNSTNMPYYFAKNSQLPTNELIWSKSHDHDYGDMHKGMGAAYQAYKASLQNPTAEAGKTPATTTTDAAKATAKNKANRYYKTTYNANGVPTNTLIEDYGDEWANANPTYQQYKTDTTAEGDTNYTNYYLKEKPQGEDDLPIFDNWLRYAPVLGAAIGLGKDLFTSPDYSNAELLEAHANRAGDYDRVKFSPIGDYLTYRPLDRQYAINLLNANAGATRRNVMNTSGGNRGQAMAGILAADYNAGNNIGNLFRQAEESNQAQRERVATFNKDTNKYNSEGDLKAQMANQSARAQAASRSFDLYGRAAAMRDAIDARRAQGIAANFTNIFDSLGNIGMEKVNRQTMKWMYDHGIYPNVGKKSSNGGKIKRRGLTY